MKIVKATVPNKHTVTLHCLTITEIHAAIATWRTCW